MLTTEVCAGLGEYAELMKDILWSDPTENDGVHVSHAPCPVQATDHPI